MGHREIGISAARSGSTAFDERYNALQAQAQEPGRYFNKEYVADVGHSEEDVAGREEIPEAAKSSHGFLSGK